MMLNIIEEGQPVGWVSDEPEFDYEYAGSRLTVERVLRDEREHGTRWDTAAGPGGVTAEREVQASAREKLLSATEAVESLPGIRFEERTETEKALEDADHRGTDEVLDDPDEPTTNSLALGQKSWVPFAGPRGGEGWKNTETGELVYQPDPPGEVADVDDISGETLEQLADEHGVSTETVREAVEEALPDGDDGGPPQATVGDLVTVEHPEFPGVEIEGVVEWTDGDFADINTNDGLLEVENEAIQSVEGADPDNEYGNYNDPDMGLDEADYERGIREAGGDDELVGYYEHYLEEGHSPDTAVRKALKVSGLNLDEQADAEINIDIRASMEERYEDSAAPDHLDPANAEEVVPMREVMSGGSTAMAMDVATMEDGSRLYITRIGTAQNPVHAEVSEEPQDAVNAVAGHDFLKALGMEVPDHHYEVNRFLSVEEARGKTPYEMMWDEDEDYEPPDLDREQAAKVGAANALLGNVDPNSGNFTIDEDGTVIPIDLDLVGSGTDTAMRNIVNNYAQALTHFGPYPDTDFDEIADSVREELAEMAHDDSVREAAEQIRDDEMRRLVLGNIEYAAEEMQ